MLMWPQGMAGAAEYRLIEINIAIPYLEIEPTLRVGAHPCLIMYGRPLAAKIRQRD